MKINTNTEYRRSILTGMVSDYQEFIDSFKSDLEFPCINYGMDDTYIVESPASDTCTVTIGDYDYTTETFIGAIDLLWLACFDESNLQKIKNALDLYTRALGANHPRTIAIAKELETELRKGQ